MIIKVKRITFLLSALYILSRRSISSGQRAGNVIRRHTFSRAYPDQSGVQTPEDILKYMIMLPKQLLYISGP